MSTTVEVMASAFKEAGTPFIVGHPGGESVELMEAARQGADRRLGLRRAVQRAARIVRSGTCSPDERSDIRDRSCSPCHPA